MMPFQQTIKNSLFVFIITASFFTGCGDKNKPAVYLARVNDSYLTNEEFAALYDSSSINSSQKQELYQQWVRTEILYQKAVDEGLTSDAKYSFLVNRAKKELAAAFLMQKISDDAKFSCSEEEMKKCYEEDKWQFVAGDKSFLYNIAYFSNEERADRFRKAVIDGSWNVAYKNTTFAESERAYLGVYKSNYQLESALLSRLLSALTPGETSPPVNTSPGRYMVVGLRYTLPPDSTPPLDAIKQLIEKRVIEKKKSEFVEKYLKELYVDSKVDILNEDF